MPDDMMLSSDQHRFEQLLPFYITNGLSSEDKAFVQEYMASHPEAKKAAQFTEKLSRIVRSTGANRNPDAALTRLLAGFEPRKKLSPLKRLLAKLKSLGISPPLAIALLVIVGQGIGYTSHKMNWFPGQQESIISKATPNLSVNVKRGADAGALAVIVEQFGGKIVHSSAVNDMQKIFINIMEKTRIQSLIDALMEAGLIESAALLL